MENPHDRPAEPPRSGSRRSWGVEDYVTGVRRGDRTALGRAITLIESTSHSHEELAQEVLGRLLPETGRSRRVGITGVPGVGKSTFIEVFGCYLCDHGLRVAVLAIDPSSSRSRGSILGDKTRMQKLSGRASAFVRPSPSGGTLGGVAQRTREVMLLCEAAGFDVVVIETVGIGQSEVALRSMVDIFVLLLLPGAGDDLQGIKRGVMEMADVVLINKADGENRARAEMARSEQSMALHHLPPATAGWKTPVFPSAGATGEGIEELWTTIERFYSELTPLGVIEARRQQQLLQWLEDLVHEQLLLRFRRHSTVSFLRPEMERAILRGDMTPGRAARVLMDAFDSSESKRDDAAPKAGRHSDFSFSNPNPSESHAEED